METTGHLLKRGMTETSVVRKKNLRLKIKFEFSRFTVFQNERGKQRMTVIIKRILNQTTHTGWVDRVKDSDTVYL